MSLPTTATDFSPSQLAAFLRTHRDAILERWRAAVEDRPAAQGLTLADLIDHIPDLLEAIADTGESYVNDNRTCPDWDGDGDPDTWADRALDNDRLFGCGCRAGSGASGGSLLLLLGALVVVARRRRRRYQ